jgi:hypothetical protein
VGLDLEINISVFTSRLLISHWEKLTAGQGACVTLSEVSPLEPKAVQRRVAVGSGVPKRLTHEHRNLSLSDREV